MVGDNPDPGDAVKRKHATNEVIDTITDDDDFSSAAVTMALEVPEARIDLDLIQEPANFVALGSDEADLLPHALGRVDGPSFPTRFDLSPFREGEAVENEVRDVLGRNGSVKVANG